MADTSTDMTTTAGTPDIGIKLLPVPQADPQGAVDALTDIIGAKKEYYQATADALQKNTQIQSDFSAKQDALSSDTIKAYDNMRKAAALPPGLTKILGLFDSSYNTQAQAITIEENQAKAQQDAQRAKTMIDINNQLPALKKAQADIAGENFDMQQKLFTIAHQATTANQDTLRLKISAAELGIKLDEATKKNVDFRLKSMTFPQAQAELKNAQAGKGDFANLQGLLEERIDDEIKTDLAHKEAVVALDQHRQALAQGNVNLQNSTLDLAEKKLKVLAERLSPDVVQPLLDKAQAKGDMNITFGSGKDAIEIPTNIVTEAYNKTSVQQATYKATAIANQADQTSQRLDKATTLAANLAASDRRAGQEFGLINNAIQKFDPKDPGSLRSMNAILTASEGRLASIQKDVEAQYKTPEARAAVAGFFTNGKFDLPGATDVVQNVTGIPGAAATMKFKTAQEKIDTAYADAVARQSKIGGMPVFTGGEASKNQLLNWMAQQQGKTKDTLTELKAQVLADPQIMTIAGNEIKGVYKVDAIGNVLQDLTKGPQAGVFNQVLKMIDNPAADTNNDLHWTANDIATNPAARGQTPGVVSTQKMQVFLERQSATLKYAVDYNKIFLDALQARAVASAKGSADPSHTINDAALETHIFGQSAQQSVYSDFLGELRANAGAVHVDMQRKIQQDQARNPSEAAMSAEDAMATSGVSLTPKQYEAIKNQAGGPQPSATGIPGATTDYIRSLYGVPASEIPASVDVTPRFQTPQQKSAQHWADWRQRYYGR